MVKEENQRQQVAGRRFGFAARAATEAGVIPPRQRNSTQQNICR